MQTIFKVLKNVALGIIIINLFMPSIIYADESISNATKFTKANVNLNDIAYNGKSTYVAVGEKGEIEVSKDGIHVSPVKVASATYNLTKVKWVGNRFIAIGDNGAILSSADGYRWILCKDTTSVRINNLESYRNFIILVGESGNIYTSTNGINFIMVKSNVKHSLNDIIYTTTKFVAVGDKGTIVVSSDGKKWSKVNSGVTQNLVDVAWNGKKYIAVGGDAILSSSDSKKWVVQHFENGADQVDVNLTKIAWNKKGIVVGGTSTLGQDNYSATSFVFYDSKDAVHWYGESVPHKMGIINNDGDISRYILINVNLLDLISANGKFIVFGYDNSAPDDTDCMGKQMLIGYLNEGSKDSKPDYDCLNNDWSVDFWISTMDHPAGPFSKEIMRKALWDGKKVTVVGDTILRYNDINGKSYTRKGKPENQSTGAILYVGRKIIDYVDEQYSTDEQYWTYDEKYRMRVYVNNIGMYLLGNYDDTPNIWTGKIAVTIAKTEEDSKQGYDAIIYSYDGLKWYDTNVHAPIYKLYKQGDMYIAEGVNNVNYTSIDGLNWTKKQ